MICRAYITTRFTFFSSYRMCADFCWKHALEAILKIIIINEYRYYIYFLFSFNTFFVYVCVQCTTIIGLEKKIKRERAPRRMTEKKLKKTTTTKLPNKNQWNSKIYRCVYNTTNISLKFCGGRRNMVEFFCVIYIKFFDGISFFFSLSYHKCDSWARIFHSLCRVPKPKNEKLLMTPTKENKKSEK